MSKHKQKYPGLYARCKLERKSYPVMYMRVRGGMTLDEAFALPIAEVDTSPNHIRKLRAAFCEEFIRTGEINMVLQQKLKDYANAKASAPDHPTDATVGRRQSPRREDRGAANLEGPGAHLQEQ